MGYALGLGFPRVHAIQFDYTKNNQSSTLREKLIMRRLFRMASLVGIVAFLAAGCGDDAPGGGNNNANSNANINQDCLPQMSIQGANQIDLMINAEVDLTVLVQDCNGDAIPGAVVSYDLGGNNGGAALSVMSSVTGSDGLASTTLTAGGSDADFTITASTPGASDVTWTVKVTTDPIGLIVVNMTYGGQKVFDKFESYLFQNHACGSLDPFNIQGAVMGAAPVTTISAHPQFPGVPEGSNYSVAVVASFQGEVLSWGCVDALNVSPGQITDADVTIDDIPVTFNGLYYLDNHFDMTNALPPSVSTILHIFDEMTDDHSLDGDSANNEYGLDPAAFLLDFIFRQFCKWECLPGENDTNCSEINHDSGDLEALYQHPFNTWSGAQPVFTGSCGILTTGIGSVGTPPQAHKWAQQEIQDLIDTWVPDLALNILQMVGDLSRVFTQMHIHSELTVDDIDISKQGNFLHELKTLEIELTDWNGTAHTYQIDLEQAGMSNVSYSGSTTASDITLTIPPHDFQLEFGKLLQYVYLNYMLPLLGYTSTADMLWHDSSDPNDTGLIDCGPVGQWLHDTIGFFDASEYENYCGIGLTAAGDFIDNSMADWVDVTATLTLQGTADAGDLDDQRVALTLVDGEWNGTMAEGTWSAPFTGTFTGTKTAP